MVNLITIMANLSLMPNYLMHQWQSNGLPLSGGVLYFYESGTFVPKSVYSTADGSVPLGTSVTLSASGTAVIFLGEGAYRIWLKDSTGAQVEPYVDGIVGSGSGGVISSNASIAIVKLYNDLRALTTVPDVVYVAGGSAEGDGGEGLFQLQPLSTLTDDGGIILTSGAGSNVYRRIFDGYIDPRWYGVKYSISLDQSAVLSQAVLGSIAHNYPILVTAPIYLNQNITIGSGASITGTIGGYFYGSSTMTFASGTNFDGESVVFGDGVQPIFSATGICDVIRLSWMGATTNEGRWSKLIASTTQQYIAYCDVSTTVTQDITVPANYSFDVVGGATVTFGGFVNLSIARFVYTGKSQVFKYNSINYVGSVSIGADKCYIEWFGGVSGGDANENAIAFKAIAMNGYWDLLVNSNYTITNATGYTSNHELRINGNGSTFTLNQHVNLGGAGIGGLWMTNVTYSASATGSITCVTFIAKDSYIWGTINCDTNLIYDSLVGNLDNISLATNSKFFNYTGTISGNVSASEIYAYGTLGITNQLTIQNSLIRKTDSTDSQKLPLFATTHNLEMLQCTIDTNGLLVYSTNESLTITLTGCYSPNNFAGALSNGYAKVNLNGCGVVNNSTAYSIDGYNLETLINIKPAVVAQTITSSITNWRGIGSISTDGTSITLGAAATLSNDPWNANTIRYMGLVDNTDTLMQTVFRYGGRLTCEVEYPAGQSPDPNCKIAVAMVVPPIGSDPTSPAAGYSYNNMPVIMGSNIPTSLPITPAAKQRISTNFWGGQVDFLYYQPSAGTTPVGDIWQDWTQSIVTSGGVGSGLYTVQRVPRIVIYNVGSGVVPAGTKFTVVINPSLPNREQYLRFWPAKTYIQYKFSTFYGDVGGFYTTNCRSSLYSTYAQAWQLDTPYMFRDCDINGLQVAVCRTPVATETKVAMDLPVASWWNGNTLNGTYS